MSRSGSHAAASRRVVLLVVAGLLAALGSGHGVGEPQLLEIELSADSRRALDDLNRGELRVTWSDRGAVLGIGDLQTNEQDEREYEKGSLAPATDGCFLVAPFENATSNRLGGGLEATGGARAELVGSADARALRVVFDADASDRPRLEISLFDDEPSDETVFYLDGSRFERLQLRVRGQIEGSIEASFVDAHQRRSESFMLSATADWQTVSLPMEIDGVRSRQLAGLQLSSHGTGYVDIDDIYLCRSGSEPVRPARRHRAPVNSL